jgi:hypothetical protein
MRRISIALGILALLGFAVWQMAAAGWVGNSAPPHGKPVYNRSPYNTEAPAGQVYADYGQSTTFRITATVRKDAVQESGWIQLTYDILVENKTDQPVRRLSIGATLDDALVPFVATHMPHFGTWIGENHDLIPGQIPKGIYVSRTLHLPTPGTMSEGSRQEMARALCKPVRLKLQWDGGEEYLLIPGAEIRFEGFDHTFAPACAATPAG